MWVESLKIEDLEKIKTRIEKDERFRGVMFDWGVPEGEYDALVTRIIEEVSESETLLKIQKNIREFRKVDNFRKERLKIERKSPGPYCFLHLVPMFSTGQESIDMESISKYYKDFIAFKENLHVERQMNSHGLLIDTNLEDRPDEQPIWSNGEYYRARGWQRTQIFHSGELESVYAPPVQGRKEEEAKYLSLYAFEFFRLQIKNCVKKAHVLGFLGVEVICVTILYAKGHSIYTPIISPRYLVQLPHKIPNDAKEVLNLAEGNIEVNKKVKNIQNLEEKDINEQILQPIFDNIWRDFGFFECDRNFKDGSWNLQP